MFAMAPRVGRFPLGPGGHHRLVAPALLFGLLAAGGCTTLVGEKGEVLRCEVENGIDPCPVEEGLECSSAGICQPIEPEPPKVECIPVYRGADPCRVYGEGLYCSLQGYCEACPEQPEAELCNGVDDNCNGLVDEGSDADSDGFTFCGGGVEALVDCAPKDPTAHPADPAAGIPAATEECDGKDNDCNGVIDDDPLCAVMPGCNLFDPTTCECDPADPTTCDPGFKCDPDTRRCVAPLDLGSACNNDSGCGDDGICIDTVALDLPEWVGSDKICARACCTDADCKGDNVCLIPGTGARVCVPATFAGLETKRAGESCSDSQECSSRICNREICQTACTSGEDCGDEYCVFNPEFGPLAYVANPGQFVCGPPQGRGKPLDPCATASGCESGLCTNWICTIPCGSDAECAPFGARCGYNKTQSIVGINLMEGTRVSYCYIPVGEEPSDVVCCKDEHCSAGTRCRPDFRNDAWGMYCMPDIL